MREMFTKSSTTQFLHDSKTLILAINCLKVAKPNVDWRHTQYFPTVGVMEPQISVLWYYWLILENSNFQHPHAVIPVLIKLNRRLLGKILLWYRIFGKNKIKCYVSTRGQSHNMPFNVGTSWHIKKHERVVRFMLACCSPPSCFCLCQSIPPWNSISLKRWVSEQ